MLAGGIWVSVGADSFKKLVTSDPVVFNAVYVIIAVGCLLIIVGFLGCCGAIKENQCMLGTVKIMIIYVIIVMIIYCDRIKGLFNFFLVGCCLAYN